MAAYAQVALGPECWLGRHSGECHGVNSGWKVIRACGRVAAGGRLLVGRSCTAWRGVRMGAMAVGRRVNERGGVVGG